MSTANPANNTYTLNYEEPAKLGQVAVTIDSSCFAPHFTLPQSQQSLVLTRFW